MKFLSHFDHVSLVATRQENKKEMLRNSVLTLVAVAFIFLAPAAAENVELHFKADSAQVRANPAIPPDFDVQLILDDDQAEGNFGVTIGGTAMEFMWFNSFRLPSFQFELHEIWVLFPAGDNMAVGNEIELVVYLDRDGDPSTGADYITSFTEMIQTVDGNTFSVYELNPPLFFDDPGDILVGVVDRFVESGVTSATLPAAIDTTASQGQSWFAVWGGDPAQPPVLPADMMFDVIDTFQPGNWMIRAFGQQIPIAIPVLQPLGTVILILMMVFAGVFLSRRLV